jgi:hypothetical protein
MLEVSGGLPDKPGVRALLETLRESGIEASIGKICGSRISAVWLGDALEVVSVTLEAAELDDADLGKARGLTFVEEVTALAEHVSKEHVSKNDPEAAPPPTQM